MKKLRFAGAILLVPLVFVCGCGGATPPLNFSANWYRRTDLTENIEDTFEQLEYAVSFDPIRSENGFSVSYSDGVYKTELKNENLTLSDGSKKLGYVLTSELTIKVSFELNGKKSETFEDSVYTEARFLSPAEKLAPVSSLRKVRCHTPYTDTPPILESCYNDYSFTYETRYNTAYNAAATTAETVYTDLLDPNKAPVTRSYDIEGDGTFLDNEQIAFALRGVNLAANLRFRSINSVTGRVQDVVLSEVSETPQEYLDWSFEADGQTVSAADVGAVSATIAYSGANGGQPQTLVYAKKTDSLSNTYRNVLLELNAPVVYSLGVLHYRLTKAVFPTK